MDNGEVFSERDSLLDKESPVKELEKSEEHRAKDFQVIYVPSSRKAVSKLIYIYIKYIYNIYININFVFHERKGMC